MRLKKAKQRRQQRRLPRPPPQLFSPDSGQIDEPLGPTLVTNRCRKSGEGKCHWVIVVRAQQCD